MKNLIYSLLFCIFAQNFAPSSFAQGFVAIGECDVVADKYIVQSNGLLSVRYTLIEPLPNSSSQNLFATVCRIGEAYRGVSPQTCSAWLNMFADSIETGKQLRIRYTYNSQHRTGCLENNWSSSPVPDYIMYNF